MKALKTTSHILAVLAAILGVAFACSVVAAIASVVYKLKIKSM